MAMSRHVRLTLRVASVPCLLLAFFPYYSQTAGPAVLPGVSTMELPLIGTLPEQPSNTVFRVGLPFSPLFTYYKEVSVESKPTSAPASTIDGNIKVDFSGTIEYTQHWRFGYFSWSMALAILGLGWLIVSFWNRSIRTRTPLDVTSGYNG